MSTASTSEHHSLSHDLGQRLFMLAIFAILVAEVLTTVVNVGHWFEWTSCILGIVASVGILCLGNWLFNGNKTALLVTRVWVLLQLALVAIAFVLLLSGDANVTTLSRHLGVNASWQGLLKLAVYVAAAGLLVLPGYTLDFLSTRRGETPASVARAATEEPAPAGNPVELAAEHTTALDGLGGAMKAASGFLVLVGVFELLTGLMALSQATAAARTAGLLSIVEGVAVAALGCVLMAPAAAIQKLLAASPRNMGFVMNVITNLLATWKAYFLILVVMAAVNICRLVL